MLGKAPDVIEAFSAVFNCRFQLPLLRTVLLLLLLVLLLLPAAASVLRALSYCRDLLLRLPLL
jgi:hypothetical protein